MSGHASHVARRALDRTLEREPVFFFPLWSPSPCKSFRLRLHFLAVEEQVPDRGADEWIGGAATRVVVGR